MSGDDVEITPQVDPQNADLENSPIVSRADGGDVDFDVVAHARMMAAHASCMWDGKEYSDGGSVCEKQSRTKYKCWNGRWVEIGMC